MSWFYGLLSLLFTALATVGSVLLAEVSMEARGRQSVQLWALSALPVALFAGAILLLRLALRTAEGPAK